MFGALIVIWLGQDQDVRRLPEWAWFLGSASLLLLPLFAAPLALVTGLAFGPLFILPLFVIALKCGLAKRQSTALTAAAVDSLRWKQARYVGVRSFYSSVVGR